MNNLIRDYVASNNKVLFDFADIESYDPDGNIILYEWDWDNDAVYDATGITQSHDYGDTVVHTVVLRVTDTISQQSTVFDNNVQALIDNPPVACFNWVDVDGPGVGTNINFDATCSSDDVDLSGYQLNDGKLIVSNRPGFGMKLMKKLS